MKTNICYQGDCLEVLKTLPENSIDSIVTDPPYHLISIVKRFGKENSAPAKFGTDGAFKRASTGFMGKTWDGGDIAFNPDMWRECLRVLKPGGHLLSFSGTRTYHRMAIAIEDAGFEVRDMIAWCYGQGFPKSLNVFKHLQKKCKCGNMEVYENRIKQMGKDSEKETEYFLRFMQEADLSQTISPKKERGEVLQSGLSEQSSHSTVLREESKESSNGGEERILERGGNLQKTEGKLQGSDLPEMSERVFTNGEERRIHNATQVSDGSTPEKIIDENGSGASYRPQSEQQQYREPCAFCKQWGTQATRTLGVGTALKPSIEPICLARKPLAEKTVAQNVLKYGTGGINIDESRVEHQSEQDRLSATPQGKVIRNNFAPGEVIKGTETNRPDTSLGRFPANLIHDNSEEVRECFPDTKSVKSARGGNKTTDETNAIRFGSSELSNYECGFNDSGNASRFFKSIIYQAKASKSERNKGCESLKSSEKFTAGNYSQSPTCKDCEKTLNGTNDHSKCSGEVYYKEMESKNTKNNHPTVKPIALMSYLIKMITPKGGIVLDHFAGSGSTLVAAKENGFQYVGIELTEEYLPIIQARTGCEIIKPL